MLLHIVIMFCVFHWYKMEIAEIIFSKYDVTFRLNNKIPILTIDDAPYSSKFQNLSLEKILNVLNNYNAKATFFVISSYVDDTNKHLLINALKNGHHLANHGMTNIPHFFQTENEFKNEFLNCKFLIERLYKEANISLPKINYFRPASGIVNSIISKVTKEFNHKIVLGTIYSEDPHIPISYYNSWYIINKIRSKNDIIIMHDRSWTALALKNIFENIGPTKSLLD